MSHRSLALVLALALVGGCQGTPLKSSVAVKTEASVAPAASTAPPAPAVSKAPPKAVTPAPVVAPVVPGVTLSGTVKLDASYLQRSGHGSVLSANGSPVLVLDGAHLEGSSLIGQDGNGVVAQGGGNVIVPAALIGQDGNGLIGQDGNGLIGQDGNGLVSGAKPRHVLDTPPTEGEQLPAAGLALYVRDLRTGLPVSLGRDAKGQAFYAVYTDLTGGYSISVPADLANTVEVVAVALNAKDSHLRQEQFANPAHPAASIALDGANTTSASLMRTTVAQMIVPIFDGSLETADANPQDDNFKDPRLALATKLLYPFALKAQAMGYANQSKQQQLQHARALADRLLAHIDFDKVDVANPDQLPPGPDGPLGTANALAISSILQGYWRGQFATVLDGIAKGGKLPADNFLNVAKDFDGPLEPFLSADDYSNFNASVILPRYVGDIEEYQVQNTHLQKALGLVPRPDFHPIFGATVEAVETVVFGLLVTGGNATSTQTQQDLDSYLQQHAPHPDAGASSAVTATAATTP